MAIHNIEYTIQGGTSPYIVRLFSGGTETQIGLGLINIEDGTYEFSDIADGTYYIKATDDAEETCEIISDDFVVETLENQYNLSFFVLLGRPKASQDPASPHIAGTEVTLTAGSNTSEYTFIKWNFHNTSMTEEVNILLLDGTSVNDLEVKLQMPNFSFIARPRYINGSDFSTTLL